MRRYVSVILFLISVVFIPLYGTITPAPYFRQYSSSFTVQLDSHSFFSHSPTATYNSGNSPGRSHNTNVYYQDQELGVVGVTSVTADGESCSVMLTITVPSEWYYRLAGSEYKRPYGLDFFARGKTGNNDVDLMLSGQRIYSVSLGYQETVRTIEEGTTITIFVPKSVVQNYSQVWWDICLVLDPETQQRSITVDSETGETIYYYYTSLSEPAIEAEILPSNQKYITDFEIAISCWDFDTKSDYDDFVLAMEDQDELASHKLAEMKYPIHLEGLFKSEAIDSGSEADPKRIIASFSINKKPGADEILMLKSGSLRTSEDDEIPIAEYTLTTSVKEIKNSTNKPSETGKVYVFMSSSRDGFNPGELFSLKHKNDPNSLYTSPFIFTVIMQSTASYPGETNPLAHAKGQSASKRTVEFDGTTQFTINGNGTGQIPSNCMQVEAEVTLQKPPTTWYAQWRDKGTISIKITGQVLDYNSSGNPEPRDWVPSDLTAGEYSSNIYVHIVSDIN